MEKTEAKVGPLEHKKLLDPLESIRPLELWEAEVWINCIRWMKMEPPQLKHTIGDRRTTVTTRTTGNNGAFGTAANYQNHPKNTWTTETEPEEPLENTKTTGLCKNWNHWCHGEIKKKWLENQTSCWMKFIYWSTNMSWAVCMFEEL